MSRFSIHNRQRNASLLKQLGIQKIILIVQKRGYQLADFLQSRTNKMSVGNITCFLILFCILASSGSVYIITKAIRGGEKIIPVTSVSVPRHVLSEPAFRKDNKFQLSEEYKRIQTFKMYMDSLVKSKTGKAISDSLIKLRPGLIDSIANLEKINR